MVKRKKITLHDLLKKKRRNEKIPWVVLYDWSTAMLADEAGVDMLLVGDSVGMTMLGYPNTLPVTMSEMIHHTRAVVRAVKYAFIIGDMPFMSYQPSIETAVRNAGRFMKAGCDAVKLEGGAEVAGMVKRIVDMGIPVMGHIGLTPQRVSLLGGYKVQGKDAETARKIVDDANALEKAGAFAVILENVPCEVAKVASEHTSFLTFSCGGGQDSDGQVLLSHDILGLTMGIKPRFAKQYANLREVIFSAFSDFCKEVREGKYPSEEYIVHMEKEDYDKLRRLQRGKK